MDLQRLVLFVALSFTLLLMWQAWQKDYAPQPPPPAVTAPAQQPGEPPADAPLPQAAAPDQPALEPGARPAQSAGRGQLIDVYTDVFHVVIDTAGGTIRRTELLQYPVAVDQPDNPFVLMHNGQEELFVAQSGLQSASGPAPDHHALYEAARQEYRLGAGEPELIVPLTWRDASGVVVTKQFTFRPGDYSVDVGFEVRNGSASPWSGRMYRQLQRTPPKESSAFIYTYTGGVWYSPEERYQKYDFKAMKEAALDKQVTGGWIAMIQHYFVAAWVPPGEQQNLFYSRALPGERYLIGAQGAPAQAAPGESARLGARLYMGPKLQDRLEAIAPGLDLTVDYGKLHIIAKPIFVLLEWIHKIVGNWGWSIILLTILIKLAFYKLSEASYRSMANMRKLQPRMKAIQERYADDKQKMQEAMMKMYREEKINPLGGCLPILVQIPVFIALYWVLLESVEMRQAPWILWINDLSTQDPFYVLPIIMGATMLIQHKLNPTPLDPVQAKVMMILPIMFTFFFLWFPAGLVIYWVVNNTLSILQQWYITRFVVKAA